ncbi:MAG: type I DNA topoisomerase [Alphaproteobacteria bacterium]|nr:MAG: type I DNA topoisomerase [Alphaproteobacteria bacterium]
MVESPAKAKSINRYLGGGYKVLASFGHVRDLPSKDGSVRPDDDFAMDWEEGEKAARPLSEIVKAVKAADVVFLATDPDREGEAIAWHVQEVLRQRKALGSKPVHRVMFHEITKTAVQKAIAAPRELDHNLIEAYLARRALDYLVGFTLSPVLWRKLPGSRSAGRVQSVALRLVCEREEEIEAFVAREYWSIEALLRCPGGEFTARLSHMDGKKLDKFAINNEADAQAAVIRLQGMAFAIGEVEKRQIHRNPPPPFITSTLQQEASRHLGLGAAQTMRLAQRLYEGVEIGGDTVGLITYMRTDSTNMAQEAVASARQMIEKVYGARYVPESPRLYRTTARNAQEAHEAIRPTDMTRRPESLQGYLDAEQLKLYDLVWKRAVASQMASALLNQVSVHIPGQEGAKVEAAALHATGTTVAFDGFQRLYNEGRDDAPGDEKDEERRLPPMNTGEKADASAITPHQHFTEPPPRYTEASLVKKMEELGIGRPSTYASILQVLQDRNYVKLERKRFIPEDRGRLVTAFLVKFFGPYVAYEFTADLETRLDDIAAGELAWKELLRRFWTAFASAVDGTKDLKISDVIDALDESLGSHFFPVHDGQDSADPRICPSCKTGRLGLKLGRFGPFIGCSNYPECRFTRPLAVGNGDDAAAVARLEGPRLLGQDPATGLPVAIHQGPYGPYVQLGEKPPAAPKTKGKKKKTKGEDGASASVDDAKPKRVSLPKGLAADAVTLEQGLALLALPREVCKHPTSGDVISAGIGRFGSYVKMKSTYRTLPPDEDVLTVGANRAVALIDEAMTKGGAGRRGAATGRELGANPQDGTTISVHSGRYGPYVKNGKIMATIPSSESADDISLERAMELIEAKAAKQPAGKKKAAAPKKTASKKAVPKKATAKTTKKAPTKKSK